MADIATSHLDIKTEQNLKYDIKIGPAPKGALLIIDLYNRYKARLQQVSSTQSRHCRLQAIKISQTMSQTSQIKRQLAVPKLPLPTTAVPASYYLVLDLARSS